MQKLDYFVYTINPGIRSVVEHAKQIAALRVTEVMAKGDFHPNLPNSEGCRKR